MLLISCRRRSKGVNTARSSNALVTMIAVRPIPSTIASDRSTWAETVAGDSARANVPAMKTAPLIRQTCQYNGNLVFVLTLSA